MFTKAAVVFTAVATLAAGAATAEEVRREHYPGMDKAIPHVSGDRNFSNTYDNWKDAAAIERAKAAGVMSHEMNFKDFRWLEKSIDGEFVLDEGRDLFNQANESGQSCASCHGTDGEKLKGVHVTFPKYSEPMGRVVPVVKQIERCGQERMKTEAFNVPTRANTMLAYWIGYLSDGMEIALDVATEGPVKESYERGKELYFRRVGQFHFACASCHTPPTVGNYLRGQRPTTFYGDATQYPIYHFPYALAGEDRGYVFTLQHQIKSCQMLSRMHQGEEGSQSMTDIETFLMAASNGHAMSIPVSEYNMNTDYLRDASHQQ
ncbi:sulfur oxidation c-type cytochrome SoxA [Novispirillum sp. DQ9]|uniref:sulfur oxidation c-type cytochrome SoxA n=1 Tax=Novispirillum sp. DQ9 TaxID=3398612 RepID=UPI003C7CDD7F